MKCEKCGFQSEPGIKYCPNCGSRVTSGTEENRIFHIEDDPGFASRDSEYIRPTVRSADAAKGIVSRRGPEHREGIRLENGKENGEGDVRKYSYSEEEEKPSIKKQQTKPVRAFLKPKLLLGLAVLVTAGILAYTFFLKDKPTSVFYELSSQAIQVYSTGNKTLILNRKGDTIHTFDQSAFSQYSRDKSAAVIYFMKPNESGNFEQYYVNDEDSMKLSINNSVFDMSADGRYLFYSKKMLYGEYGMYRYDRKTKKEVLLLQVEDQQIGLIKVSPDGKTLTYTLIPENYGTGDNREIETFLMKDGEDPESLGDDLVVMAVSNNAEYLYYYNYDLENNVINSLHARRNGKDTKLLETLNMNFMWMNQDYSEMLYSDGRDTYLYDGSDEIHTVTRTAATEIILPYQYQAYNHYDRMIMTHSYKSFQNKLIRCSDGTVRRINQKDEAEMICRVDPECQIALSSDGNSLLYTTSEGSIKKVSDISGKCRETDLVNQMNSFIATADLSQVYYLIGEELFYKEGDKEALKIAGGVYALMSNGDYSGAFFQTDIPGESGVLNYSCKGSEPEYLFEEAYAADLTRLDYGCAVRLTVFGGYEYYYNSEGSNMMRIEDEIR